MKITRAKKVLFAVSCVLSKIVIFSKNSIFEYIFEKIQELNFSKKLRFLTEYLIPILIHHFFSKVVVNAIKFIIKLIFTVLNGEMISMILRNAFFYSYFWICFHRFFQEKKFVEIFAKEKNDEIAREKFWNFQFLNFCG